MGIISGIHRPDSISLAVEFTDEALTLNSDTEIAMLLMSYSPMTEFMRPLTSNVLFFDPMMAQYAGLNSIPNIKASQYFNANYDFPGCFIIALHQEVDSGTLRVFSRLRTDRYAPIEEEVVEFSAFQ